MYDFLCWRELQVVMPLIIILCLPVVTCVVSGPDIFLSTPTSNTYILLLLCESPDKTGTITVLFILLCFWVANRKTDDSGLNGCKLSQNLISSNCAHNFLVFYFRYLNCGVFSEDIFAIHDIVFYIW